MTSNAGGVERVWIDNLFEPLRYTAVEDIRRATRSKRYRRYDPLAVDFVRKGNYTCAIVELVHEKLGVVRGVGFAKRRPSDKYDPLVGKYIAMRRAIEDAVNG